MSWSPDLYIGELRPWPDSVHVVRGNSGETRRYMPERKDGQEALERRIDELCAEVEALKRDEWSAGFNAGCDAVNAAIEEGKAHYEAENAKLRGEVERLHADQAHWELGNCPSCPNVVSLQEALEQNAKLRELAQRLLTEYRYIRVRPRRMYLEHEVRMRVIEDEMRSLGIEVDG